MISWVNRCLVGKTKLPANNAALITNGLLRFNSTSAPKHDSEDTELEIAHIKYMKQRELARVQIKMKTLARGHAFPGSTHYAKPIHDHLFKGRPIKQLTAVKIRNSGRNNTGKITVRGRGGGHKRRARIVDSFRLKAGKQEVMRIEYDPTRSGHIALLKHLETGNLSYILAAQGLRQGDIVESFRAGIPKDFIEEMNEHNNGEIDDALLSARILQRGNCLPLSMLPVGSIVHNVGLHVGGRGQLMRAAGTFAKVLSKNETTQKCVLKLNSGEHRYVDSRCCATLGIVSNKEHQLSMMGKAGRARYRGIRPITRGVAMNAVDHPHGGGRGKSKSNKQTQSMWGLLKFKKTRTHKHVNKMKVKDRREK